MIMADAIALLALAGTILGVAFAFGKQAQSIATNGDDINRIGIKLDGHIGRFDTRLDETAKFVVRVDQRVANLERQIYGDSITEILRSGSNFRPDSDDDTVPM